MSIKKIYLLLGVILIAFFSFQCGENKKSNTSVPQEEQAEASPAALKGNSEKGKEYFLQTCAACHGTDAKGLPKLGKSLVANKFVQEKSDKELLKFIETGRQAGDPLNTTGVAMPPKGGNPALTDQQIMDIIAYMRTLQ